MGTLGDRDASVVRLNFAVEKLYFAVERPYFAVTHAPPKYLQNWVTFGKKRKT